MSFNSLTLIQIQAVLEKDSSFETMDLVIARDKDIAESVEAMLEMIELELDCKLHEVITTEDPVPLAVIPCDKDADIHNLVTSALGYIKELYLDSMQNDYLAKLNVLTKRIHS